MAELADSGIYKEWWASLAVVALMGFGLTLMATSLHNVGYWSAGPTLALAITFGGTTQIIAGIVDLRKGSIFGGSAFMSYGAFWWSWGTLSTAAPHRRLITLPRFASLANSAPHFATHTTCLRIAGSFRTHRVTRQ